MSRNLFAIVALLLVVALVGAFFYWQSGPYEPAVKTEVTEEMRSYSSDVHGYSLSYPAYLEQREYGPDNVVFGRVLGESIEGVVEVRVMTVEGQPAETMIDTVAAELITLCAADGPAASFACTGVEQVQPFVTTSGLSGQILYLRGELTDLSTGSSTTIGKGPYFVIPLQSSATGSRVVVVHPPLNQTAAEAEAQTIRRVAMSVQVEGIVTSDPVATYVRDNISTLSPEPAVLGGTFYVTDIEIKNGTGTVEYEDGHIALVADFTYSIDADGTVSIDSFTVRE